MRTLEPARSKVYRAPKPQPPIIDAMKREARTRIETHSVHLQEQIVSASLTTEAARSFLEQMPAVPALMPNLDAKALIGTGDREQT